MRQDLWHAEAVDGTCGVWTVSRQKGQRIPVETRVAVVLAVISGEMTASEAARRHGVSRPTIDNWRLRFIAAGRAGLQDRLSGPGGVPLAERRLKAETEQLKLALAEATVQLRIWQKGAELAEQIPSETSRH